MDKIKAKYIYNNLHKLSAIEFDTLYNKFLDRENRIVSPVTLMINKGDKGTTNIEMITFDGMKPLKYNQIGVNVLPGMKIMRLEQLSHNIIAILSDDEYEDEGYYKQIINIDTKKVLFTFNNAVRNVIVRDKLYVIYFNGRCDIYSLESKKKMNSIAVDKDTTYVHITDPHIICLSFTSISIIDTNTDAKEILVEYDSYLEHYFVGDSVLLFTNVETVIKINVNGQKTVLDMRRIMEKYFVKKSQLFGDLLVTIWEIKESQKDEIKITIIDAVDMSIKEEYDIPSSLHDYKYIDILSTKLLIGLSKTCFSLFDIKGNILAGANNEMFSASFDYLKKGIIILSDTEVLVEYGVGFYHYYTIQQNKDRYQLVKKEESIQIDKYVILHPNPKDMKKIMKDINISIININIKNLITKFLL